MTRVFPILLGLLAVICLVGLGYVGGCKFTKVNSKSGIGYYKPIGFAKFLVAVRNLNEQDYVNIIGTLGLAHSQFYEDSRDVDRLATYIGALAEFQSNLEEHKDTQAVIHYLQYGKLAARLYRFGDGRFKHCIICEPVGFIEFLDSIRRLDPKTFQHVIGLLDPVADDFYKETSNLIKLGEYLGKLDSLHSLLKEVDDEYSSGAFWFVFYLKEEALLFSYISKQ